MTCDRYISNSSNFIKVKNPYQGIPENFLINIVVFLILIGVFLFLRRKAWNYGDLAWLHKPLDILEAAPLKGWTYNSMDDADAPADKVSISEGGSVSLKNRIWKLIPLFAKMSDKMLEKRCGIDAVIYCKFQRGLIFVAGIMTVLCLTIIVPLNWQGGLLSNDSSSFKTLTIANMPKESNLLAIHLCVALVLMLFSFYISHRFLNYIDNDVKEKPTFTLMITNVPSKYSEKTLIEQHFQEAYPSVKILKIQQAYEIGQLFDLYTKKMISEEALIFCYDVLEEKKTHIMVPVNGKICQRCKCCQGKDYKTVDGVEFYKDEVTRWTDLYLKEKSNAINTKRLPIFFVSLENLQQALQVRREYIYQNYCCLKQIPKSQSSVSKVLKTQNWKVMFAAMPKDILWENLHKRSWRLWVPIILANIFVGFFVILLSTPAVVLQTLSMYNITKKVENISVWGSQFFPSLAMALIASLMPVLVIFANDMSSHWTKTKQSIAIMNKLFAVLVTTILVLPSLGLNSVYTLFEILTNTSKTAGSSRTGIPFECIFMPDGGALFCNYLITASFIGLGVALLRIGELLTFAFKLCYSRSRAENNAIAKSLMWDFAFGLNYAWTLALFCMMAAYSVIVPLINPFGLAYLSLKHLLDRYNMIYVYSPTIIDNEVHANAAMLMQICLLFTQVTVTVFIYFRRYDADALVICCFLSFCLGIVLMLGRFLKRLILDMAWIKYHDKSTFTDLTRIFRRPRYNLTTLMMDEKVEPFVFIPHQITQSDNDIFLEKLRKISVSAGGDNILTFPGNKSFSDNEGTSGS